VNGALARRPAVGNADIEPFFMGNSASATLSIVIDQPALYAGDEVSGKVYLAVPYETHATSLQLVLSGTV